MAVAAMLHWTTSYQNVGDDDCMNYWLKVANPMSPKKHELFVLGEEA